MPELPEVHTTVEGLKKTIVGKTIKGVWSDFHIGTAHGKRQTIKNKKYFEKFRKLSVGVKIKSVERRGKNILIHLNNNHTIIVHMKMTGHLMVENYEKEKKFIHLVFSLSNKKFLVLSDMRKFASVCVARTEKLSEHEGLKDLGPDPLQIGVKEFSERLGLRKNWPIKSALLDQSALAGIGNIYSDEALWQAGVHPFSPAKSVPGKKLAEIYRAVKKIMKFSILKGGDSKSDYRNIFGEKGGFQNFHKVYGRKKERCLKRGCSGIIERTVVRGRSAHFCPKHQKRYG